MKLEDIKAKTSIIEFIKSRPDLKFKFFKDGKDVKATLYKTDSTGEIIYDDHKPIKISSIIISRLNDDRSSTGLREIYFDLNNFERGKSKSIIDFVSEYVLRSNTVNFKQCTKILYDYMDSKSFVPLDKSSMPVFQRTINNQKKQIDKVKMNFPTKGSFDYLSSRKIPASVYGSQIFLGTFGSYTDDKLNIHDKPCFPLITADDKLQTLQYIQATFPERIKRFIRDRNRAGAMYTSQKQKGANTIIISESPEKSMAHYALYKEDLLKYKINPVYKSPCGNMTLTDVDCVLDYSRKNGINNYLLAFDNDKAGQKFTLQTILGLRNLTCSINTNDLTKPKTTTFIGVRDTIKTISKILNVPDSNSTELIVENDLSLIIDKLSTKNIQNHTSITKDFLDDLKDKLYLPKRFEKPNSMSL